MSWTSPGHSIIPTVGIINYCLCFFLSALALYHSHRFMDPLRISQGLSLCSADRCRTTSRDLSTASHSFSLVSFDRHSVLIKVPSSSLQNSHCGNFVSSKPSRIHSTYTYYVVLVGHFLIKVSSIPTVGIVPLSPSASQSLYRQNSLHCQVIVSPQISCVPSHGFPLWEFMTWNLLDIGYPSRIFQIIISVQTSLYRFDICFQLVSFTIPTVGIVKLDPF